jgi:hypothetical protein
MILCELNLRRYPHAYCLSAVFLTVERDAFAYQSVVLETVVRTYGHGLGCKLVRYCMDWLCLLLWAFDVAPPYDEASIQLCVRSINNVQ